MADIKEAYNKVKLKYEKAKESATVVQIGKVVNKKNLTGNLKLFAMANANESFLDKNYNILFANKLNAKILEELGIKENERFAYTRGLDIIKGIYEQKVKKENEVELEPKN